MPKPLTTRKVLTARKVTVEHFRLFSDEKGHVTSMPAQVAVDYDAVAVTREEVDLWEWLSADEKAAVQAIFTKLATGLTSIYVG